jgi:nickel-type superoxide dismutase maturation protease
MFLAFLRIEGHSMSPFLKPQDIVFASSIPYFFSNPKVGDVVVTRINGKNIIKRISSTLQEKYYLEGDNKNDSMDSKNFGPVLKKNIVGKVIFSFS